MLDSQRANKINKSNDGGEKITAGILFQIPHNYFVVIKINTSILFPSTLRSRRRIDSENRYFGKSRREV